ncbi:uncharacterized protein LOC119664761, partial [Teleopsis dalmanni]
MYRDSYIGKIDDLLQSYISTGACSIFIGDQDQLSRKIQAQYRKVVNPLCRLHAAKPNLYPSSINASLKKLLSSSPTFPYLYGTIKTHKLDNPVRPICSPIQWYSHPLHKLCQFFLSAALQSKLSCHNLSNINKLTDHLLQLQPRPGYVLVTMAIREMYPSTRIPPLWDLLQFFMGQDWFKAACPIDVSMLQSILDFILHKANYFTFNGDLYQQHEGLPQGGGASGLLATIFLDAQIELNYNPLFLSHSVLAWWKYIDDVLLYMPSFSVSSFMDAFPRLIGYDVTYTVEKPDLKYSVYPCVAYLDHRIFQSSHAFLVNVYHKSTESMRLTHYTSHTSIKVKQSVLSTHLRRVFYRTSDTFLS